MSTEVEALPESESPEPPVPAPPVTNRFLFVDIAAQRAKQLRRGARPRLEGDLPVKKERVAMREVGHGLIQYTMPEPRPTSESRG